MVHCFLLNGVILLGSTLVWERLLQPIVSWLLAHLVAPSAGALVAHAAGRLLLLAFHGLWLLPVYAVTLLISCTMYTDVAKTAYIIKAGQGADGKRPTGHDGDGLEDVAQEVYRVVLFCVFYAEVYLVAQLPYIGPLLNVLFLSWLYAYYCYDYKWALQRVPLASRLAYFERRWAFFAGFGLTMALSTALLPFYRGAAVLAVLFPVHIMVACDSDVNAVHERVVGKGGEGRLRHLPIFALALWPTQRVVDVLTGGAAAPPGAPPASRGPRTMGAK